VSGAYSRAGAGAVIFSKQTPDLLAGVPDGEYLSAPRRQPATKRALAGNARRV
jgi:hypothetical protein